MSHIPDPYSAIILALAAFRIFRLAAFDVITRPLRIRYITHRAEVEGSVYIGGGKYRPKVDEFLHCPWCLGFWLTIGVWGAWLAWPHATILLCVPWALASIVGLVSKNWDD